MALQTTVMSLLKTGEKYNAVHIWWNLPNFVINFLTLENLQSPNLVENLWFVETDQVMDNHIRGPDVLKNHFIRNLITRLGADKIDFHGA